MPETYSWNRDEEAVFKQMGVSKNDAVLRLLIRGQRRINGRIFESLRHLLKCFPRKGLSPECLKALAEAQSIIDKIPGEDPPFCEQSPFK